MENSIEKRKCPDGSVGVIFRNKEGKILLLERLTEPLGWAPPAGHLDGQRPGKQAIVESFEEVGLNVKKLKLILGPVEIMNSCRRPKNSQVKYNCHDWWVYKVLEWNGKPKSNEPKKIGEIKWVDISEISGLKLDPAWEILFPTIDIHI